jgi:phosphatidylserine synthase
VYSDDVADGVNYGLAPGVALYYLLGGAEAHLEGLIIGAFYGTFTISRLIFFTLNKDESDPNYFAGIPSPVGGMIVMCGVVLFRGQPTWVSFLAGVACAQMVSFSTSYRHLGRAFSRANRTRRVMWGAPMYLGVFLIGALVWGTRGAAAVVLAGALTYGFLPSAMSFVRLIRGPEA